MKRKKLKSGRPKLTVENIRVSVLISKETLERIKEIGELTGHGFSYHIRNACDNYIKKGSRKK